jgi:hypothetical protein
MKNALTHNCGESVPDKRSYTAGILVSSHNSVRAAVLATLLQGTEMTGMDSVFSHSTTRLSAVVHTLEKQYGWSIEHRHVQVNAKDGRKVRIMAYSLAQAVIDQAMSAGAGTWIEQVKIARAQQRQAVVFVNELIEGRTSRDMAWESM